MTSPNIEKLIDDAILEAASDYNADSEVYELIKGIVYYVIGRLEHD